MILTLRDRTYDVHAGEPLVMGIVNLGRDSVADGNGRRATAEHLEFALRQRDLGADIIDLGVQSGRTDTPPVEEGTEIEALVRLVAELVQQGVVVSVDTWRPKVAQACIDAGASVINDVSGLADVALADVAANSGAGLVVMHTRAIPKHEHFPGYADPMADVMAFLGHQMNVALERGVKRSQLILDPGPDFSKTPRETLAVLRRFAELGQLGLPILLAVSRKYFIGMLTGKPPGERLAGTLAAIDFGVRAGAHVVRVHDVASVCEYLRVRRSLYGDHEPEFRGSPLDEALKWLPSNRA